eukprot:TRINITY_DN5272_c0_g1_i1.p1 TRINITY_DN5272_c0_g1~~TRINITY_DN5272_c0_g1_i1.p1  ORF type:complete len:158 (-),score=25.73 TRINITY_DN5272_c0_g1_i1:238-657(-)
MTKKRRNGGKSRPGNSRGHVGNVRCANCFRCVPKDKAVGRYIVRNMVEAAAQRDMSDASVYEEYAIPKLYTKQGYCISCAIHAKIVRARPLDTRSGRVPPVRVKPGQKKPNIGKPLRDVKRSARRIPKPAPQESQEQQD